MLFKEILFYVVVLFANIIQCITGFAGTVLAMPFSLMLVGYSVAKPVLNVLGIVASIGVVATNLKSVNVKELAKISSIMLVGMVLGGVINNSLSLNEAVLYKLLGSIVIVFMLLGCYTTFMKDNKNSDDKAFVKPNAFKSVFSYFILVLAGLVHGMFVCGGPLLIVYASDRLKDRGEFRATLSAIWIILNSIIMISDIRTGYFNPRLLVIIAISVIILFAALLIGNYAAKRMSNKVFMIITYVLMGISGLSLLLK